jgi:thiazole synthase
MMLYGYEPVSRLLLGTALYPSDEVMADAIRASGTEIVTVALRRETVSAESSQILLPLIHELNLRVLPNTGGCRTAREAVTIAHMAREVFGTPWIKLEVANDDATLSPNIFELVEAARILGGEGFEIFPYTTEDLVVAERLVAVGCRVLMPWGAPVGSGRGLMNP